MESTERIKTYVFIDLETTGLPNEEQNRTKITEISLVAVKRSHILHSKDATIRVKHKLTLCFNPGRIVSSESTEKTGLCNYLLEKEPTFKNSFDVIDNFIKSMESPVCLLAHNGFKFDFPILNASVANIKRELPVNLLCADTLIAYHDIINDLESKKINEDDVLDCSQRSQNTQDLSTCEELQNMSSIEENSHESSDETDYLTIQKENETTPKSKTFSSIPGRPSKRKMAEHTHTAKRRLTWQESSGKTLENIYKSLVKETHSYTCHEAESDCLMNLDCAVAVREEFVRWVDENHCSLKDIPPMTVGIPLK